MPDNSANLRRKIGVVLQETALYDELTTFENLEFAASLYNVPEPRKRIEEVLELLMLSSRSKQFVRTLSGGMRRRVAIARALVHDPELLIIDEPTLGVDVEARHAIWEHLRMLKAKGRTTLVSTNYLDEAQALCDKVAVFREGKLLSCETPESLIARAGHCLDVECRDDESQSISETLGKNIEGILRVDKIPGGLTVVLNRQAVSKDIMNVILKNSEASGFRLRAPDLVEVFKSLDSSRNE
jgi:ABC-2 type transport system ATP-binding protein